MLHHDPYWPRASAWLAGDCAPDPAGLLAVIGAPVARGSITPGRCDLAPEAIRRALQRFSTADLNAGHDLRRLRAADAGDLDLAPLGPNAAFEPLRVSLERCVSDSTAVVVLGGDNSITYPGVRALGLPLEECGLLTFDAHFDLRHLENGLTNGNPVRALLHDGLPGEHIVQIGIQSFANSPDYARIARDARIGVVTAEQVAERGIAAYVTEALDWLSERTSRIYVDLDVDVLDRAFAPAAPGSRPGGLTPTQLRTAARICGRHPSVRVMDIVEIDPEKDIGDCTALAAASFLLEFASGVLDRFNQEPD